MFYLNPKTKQALPFADFIYKKRNPVNGILLVQRGEVDGKK